MNTYNLLAAGMALFFLLPFLTAFIWLKLKGSSRSYLVYYRHFVVINVFMTSIIVGLRLIFESEIPAAAFSPAVQSLTIEYGSMIILVGILSVISALQSNMLKLVPALSWAPMLSIAAILDLLSMWRHPQLIHTTLMLHVVNNIVIAAALFMFAAAIYKRERRIITCFAGSL